MDDEDETERGRRLISTEEGWRTEMAKWIFDARQAECEEEEDEEDDFPAIPAAGVPIPRSSKPLKFTLAELFGDLQKRARRSRRVIDEEAELMEALANADEDAIPDDGAIEIDDDEVYQG